jgi:hypothetical protein
MLLYYSKRTAYQLMYRVRFAGKYHLRCRQVAENKLESNLVDLVGIGLT